MKAFDLTEQGDSETNRMPSQRLLDFTKAIYDALVPSAGKAFSVQGELVRANDRLLGEYLRNGMCNYFVPDEDGAGLAGNYYGGLLLFMLDTLIANQGNALSAEDVAYFMEVRENAETQWRNGLRSDELYWKGEEGKLSPEEQAELEKLEEMRRGPSWEELCERAERCIANWCLANPILVDRKGRRIVEGGVSDVMEIFAPGFKPSPPPSNDESDDEGSPVLESRVPPSVRAPSGPCSLCGGKGWIKSKVTSAFPTMCSCRH